MSTEKTVTINVGRSRADVRLLHLAGLPDGMPLLSPPQRAALREHVDELRNALDSCPQETEGVTSERDVLATYCDERAATAKRIWAEVEGLTDYERTFAKAETLTFEDLARKLRGEDVLGQIQRERAETEGPGLADEDRERLERIAQTLDCSAVGDTEFFAGEAHKRDAAFLRQLADHHSTDPERQVRWLLDRFDRLDGLADELEARGRNRSGFIAASLAVADLRNILADARQHLGNPDTDQGVQARHSTDPIQELGRRLLSEDMKRIAVAALAKAKDDGHFTIVQAEEVCKALAEATGHSLPDPDEEGK